MGCCVSRIERQEMVSRCRARKKYMKLLLHSRQCLSVSHSFYLRSLRSTGATLLHFSAGESSLHHHYHHNSHRDTVVQPLPPPPPPPPPMSPTTDTWTTTTTTSGTNATPLPPPPPPPPVSASGGSNWDYWDPFEVDVKNGSTTEESVAAAESGGGGGDMTVVVSRQGKELVEIIKELDDYFLRAADSGGVVSRVLELPSFSNNNNNIGIFSF